ncbi:hypothetical protein PV341_21705 [Streptomyces sp. PA03-1a]|nr:hypothetical protein [Streptomyces sp. PA03-1a]
MASAEKGNGRAAVEEVQYYLIKIVEDAGHGVTCTGASTLVIVHVPKSRED